MDTLGTKFTYPNRQTMGGYVPAEQVVTVSELTKAKAFAETSFKESQFGSFDVLVSLVSARAQIVAGINYELLYNTNHCHQVKIVLTQGLPQIQSNGDFA